MKANKDLAIELQNVMGQLKRASSFSHGQSKLRGAERHILLLIAELTKSNPVTITEIANRIGVTLAAVTHQVNALEKAGFIERLYNKEDRRVVLIKLSGEGQAQVAITRKEFTQKIQKLTDYLGERDTESLIHLVKKISQYPGFTNKND